MIKNNQIDKDEYAAMCKTFQTLKFPLTYRIEIVGENYYAVIGDITEQQYDYWSDPTNEPYLKDMARGHMDYDDIPDFAMLFEDGIWWECCDIAEAYGAMLYDGKLSHYCDLMIYDYKNVLIHQIKLNTHTISMLGIELEQANSCYLGDLPPGMCVFVANSTELYDYFEGEVRLADAFDLTKLKLVYSIVDGLELITHVYYDNQFVCNKAGNHQVETDVFYVYQA